MLAHEHLHHKLQHGMMRQRMKGWKTEDPVVNHFEGSVILKTSSSHVCQPIAWITV